MDERSELKKSGSVHTSHPSNEEKAVRNRKWLAHSGHALRVDSVQRPHFQINFGNSR